VTILKRDKGSNSEAIEEGFKFKPLSDVGGLYSLDYELGTTVGSIDLRSIYDEKGELHLFFIFHESYLMRRNR
ncbi:MAG: hypothetical protein ACRD8Z_10890, partial [Nitrososphaeraceae archaeon]